MFNITNRARDKTIFFIFITLCMAFVHKPPFLSNSLMVAIWVGFPRTGNLTVLWHF